MRDAKGEYIVFIDQDDSFADGALAKVRDYIKANPGLDIVMYDFELINSGDVKHDMYNDSQEIMSGRKFIQTQQIPWCPWCYAYRREFMFENDIFFEENVRFEDTDFTIRSTIAAKKMAYIPVKVVKYLYWEGQTCKIGEDFQRIYDYFKMSRRIRVVGENILKEDPATAKAVMGHHHFMHKANIQRYLWRLPFKQNCKFFANVAPILPAPTACYRSPLIILLHLRAFSKPQNRCFRFFVSCILK